MSQKDRTCQNCKQNFAIEPEDFGFYEMIKVPPPTFCWHCRFQRRLAFRNERKPFWGVSAKTGKRIFSLYPAESGVVIYEDEEWLSDDWDALSFGADYDFKRPFFEQFRELLIRVPHPARSTEGDTNCDYLVNTGWSKNCYLICNTTGAEDCAYGNAADYSKSCFDNSHINKCERCYGNFWIKNSSRTHFSSRSIDNVSCWFCFGCRGLTDCFGCVNLKNKSYHIFNQPYSKEEYERKIKEMRLNTWSGLGRARDGALAFSMKFPHAYLNGVFNNDVTGEYISDSKNVHYGYLVNGGKDLKYVQYMQIPGAEDSYDLTIWGDKNILAYENGTSGWGIANSKFLLECWSEIINTEYSMFCRNVSDVFGCVGLRNKQYCIFNRQYSKEEYFALKEKIKKHMDEMPYADKAGRVYKYGEFFPIEFSPFGYNTSLAMEHFPLTREKALREGYSWQETSPAEFNITITADRIPDAIEDASDEIIKEIIQCAECKRAYRVIEPELSFLREEKIPLPRTCVDCRHQERISQRSKAFLYRRACQCQGGKSSNGVYVNVADHPHGPGSCPNEFETSYAPDRSEIVYCHDCYYAEVA
ncbi:MAG: hypothetical protein V1856_00530 [Candidatus Liptonbacteria bacterium]